MAQRVAWVQVLVQHVGPRRLRSQVRGQRNVLHAEEEQEVEEQKA